jgi:uncharacterized repeat protein (TIGR01451 family)
MAQKASTEKIRRPMGTRAFIIIWLGQVVSILGSAMTAFAVTIWIYGDTGKATALALSGFFFVTPLLLFSPIAGAMIDRYNRRLMMIVSDLASGATTIVLLALYTSGHLQVWQLFVLNAINGTFQAFQWPAFSAAISMMVPKEQYGRANGMMELAGTGSHIFAPVLAGALLVPLGLGGILMIDIFTFVFAVATLLFVYIPQPETTPAGREAQGNLITESMYGFRYIWKRPSLLGLQLVFMFGNFFVSIAAAVYAAMILARTANNELVFGTVQSVGAIGGVLGAAAMAAWGGPRRRVNGVLGGWILSGLFYALAGVARSLPAWAAAGFLSFFLIPIINGSNQAIWQAKVAPDVQGRVFSIRRLIAWFVSPLAALIAGPLVDLLLEPAMVEGGTLADAWGWLVGIGAGAGMALLFVIGGLFAALVGLIGYTVPAVRDAEDILPDHDSAEALAEREAEAVSPLEPQPASAPWSLSRKIGTASAAAVLAVLIVGLGWLQVQAFTATADEDVAQEISDIKLETTAQPDPTAISTRMPELTQQPTPTIVPPTSSPSPTIPPATATVVAPTATAVPAIVAGDLVSYTLIVANNGPSRATGVVVSDTLAPGALFNWAYFSQGTGCRVIGPAQSANEGDVVACDLGALDVGAEAVITFAVTIDPAMVGMIINEVAVGANEHDPNRADNAVRRENMVYAEADLAVRVNAPETVVAGEVLSYTVTVINNGPMDATDVTLTNGLSAVMTFVSASSDQGRGCRLGQEVTLFDESITVMCDLGVLSSGGSATVTVFASVQSSAEGAIDSLVRVGAQETDLQETNNVTNTMIGVATQADLAIVPVDAETEAQEAGVDLTIWINSSSPVVAGNPLTYTLTITNAGPLMATSVVLHDVLPAGVELASATLDQGQGCGLGPGGVVSCFLGNLDSGVTRTVSIVVTVDPGTTGTITNLVTVAANEADPFPANNTITEETAVHAEADLTIR